MLLPLRMATPDTVEDLQRRVAKLERINASLMAHVERVMDQHGSAYSLFQTAITLEGQVRTRTEEMTALMVSLERSNDALKAAKDEAERANRSKTRFLAAASHDLLQPVNAARLSLSALSNLDQSDEAQSITGRVERGLQTIESLIKTLIDISKLDAGIVVPSFESVRLADVFAGLDASFRPFAERKGLRLLTRSRDFHVESDPLLLQRILQNLVSNAVRYTGEGGVIVAARRVGGGCRVDVIDTGCGIAEAEQTRVFDEFFRGRSGDERNDGGLGLGLSIVRRSVDTLGHRLDLASRQGHGTRISLYLKIAPAAASDGAQLPQVATRLTGARVLILENDHATTGALAQLLRSWDAEVQTFRNLAEIIATGEHGLSRPDVMIIDYDLDQAAIGLDAVARLRESRGWSVPVVVATADHSSVIEQAVTRAGAELVHKPVNPSRLRSLLTHLLG